MFWQKNMPHVSSPDMWGFMKFKNREHVNKVHDMHLGQLNVKIKNFY